MHRPKDFARLVLSAVAEETEIPDNVIMSKCSRAEVVDARWLVVMLLYKACIYPSRIAELVGITPRYVHYIITDFNDRIAYNPPLRINYERIANKLGFNSEMLEK